MIRALVPLGLMHVHELLDDVVTELAGARHARQGVVGAGTTSRKQPRDGATRWPTRTAASAARCDSVAGGEIPLRSYEAARADGQLNDVILQRTLYGMSCRNYEAASESVAVSDRLAELHGV